MLPFIFSLFPYTRALLFTARVRISTVCKNKKKDILINYIHFSTPYRSRHNYLFVKFKRYYNFTAAAGFSFYVAGDNLTFSLFSKATQSKRAEAYTSCGKFFCCFLFYFCVCMCVFVNHNSYLSPYVNTRTDGGNVIICTHTHNKDIRCGINACVCVFLYTYVCVFLTNFTLSPRDRTVCK